MVSFIWKMQIKISLRFCLTLVFQGNLCDANSGACLSTDQLPQPGLSLYGAVGDSHLETQGRQENHQLNGAHVKGSHCQVSLLVLHQAGDCIDPCLKDRRSFGRRSPLPAIFFSGQVRGLCLFSYVVSGLSLWASVSSWVAVCRSRAGVNWLMAGGTFSHL